MLTAPGSGTTLTENENCPLEAASRRRPMSPNRIVAVATPLLFAPLAGAVSAWLAEHFPGFNVDQSSLEEIFIAGALIGLAPAAQ
jgi:hypothetical protein